MTGRSSRTPRTAPFEPSLGQPLVKRANGEAAQAPPRSDEVSAGAGSREEGLVVQRRQQTVPHQPRRGATPRFSDPRPSRTVRESDPDHQAGERLGFRIGDPAGVGRDADDSVRRRRGSRQLAAGPCWCRGRGRSLWVNTPLTPLSSEPTKAIRGRPASIARARAQPVLSLIWKGTMSRPSVRPPAWNVPLVGWASRRARSIDHVSAVRRDLRPDGGAGTRRTAPLPSGRTFQIPGWPDWRAIDRSTRHRP